MEQPGPICPVPVEHQKSLMMQRLIQILGPKLLPSILIRQQPNMQQVRIYFPLLKMRINTNTMIFFGLVAEASIILVMRMKSISMQPQVIFLVRILKLTVLMIRTETEF